MMKKAIALLFILTFFCAGAFADDFPVLGSQVEIRQAHLDWITTIQRIGMEASIDYIDEISEGQGTAELSSILSKFNAKVNDAMALTTHVALNNALRQLRDITTEFRQENRAQMQAYDGRNGQLLAKIAGALVESEAELNALKDAYWDKRKTNALEIFGIRVERAQNILNKLDEKGYGISEAQAKLDEIVGKRSELESALDARNNLEIVAVHLEIFELSKELIQIVIDLQVQIPQPTRIRHWIGVGERVVERTATIISELKGLGMDVSTLEEIHSKAEEDLEKAKEAFEAGNNDDALDALQDLKQDFADLKKAYRSLVFGDDVPDEIEEKVVEMSDALEETVEEMAELE